MPARSRASVSTSLAAGSSDAVAVPGTLRDPRAHRARECLLHVVGNPGVSNHELARALGIGHPAQISRLLTRLAALGLLEKQRTLPGGPNAWWLTDYGRRVSRALADEM